MVAIVSPQMLRAARRRGRLNRAARRVLSPRPPRAAALKLTKLINRRLDAFNRAIEELLLPALRDNLRTDAVAGFIQGPLDILQLRLRTTFRDSAISTELQEVGLDVAKQNANQLRRTIGIAIRDTDFGLGPQIDQFIATNVSRIKSLAGEQLVDITEILSRPGALGLRVEDLAKQIQDRFKVTKSKASLLARDQTLTLNSSIARNRQQNAGITEYVWTTSGDERVREAHAELDGTVQRWNDPPVTSESGATNHPGEDFQCRCTAFPVLPELGLDRFE